MEESGAETQNGHTHRGRILQSHFKRMPFQQNAFVYLQFVEHQMPNVLVEQHHRINDDFFQLTKAATDDLGPIGGDVAMC
jgi:hypothetical protein